MEALLIEQKYYYIIHMNKNLRYYYELELEESGIAIKNKKIELAWKHLERAHILGQFFWKAHAYSHYKMLVLSFKSKNMREFFSQIPRLILAIPGSVLHIAPKGNVGTGRVGIFERMTVPEDLQKILQS